MAPWSGRNSTDAASEIDGQPIPATRDFRRDPARRVVSPEYFAALDIPLTRGRVFTREEASSKAPRYRLSSRRRWPAGIGRVRIRSATTFACPAIHEVIGVCRDVQSVSFMRDDGPFYYVLLDASAIEAARHAGSRLRRHARGRGGSPRRSCGSSTRRWRPPSSRSPPSSSGKASS